MSDDPNNGENDTPPRSSKGRKVGYRSPPRKHCFGPGQSGNPRGRPKGSKNKPFTVNDELLNDIVLEEAFHQVKLNQGARRITMTMVQAAVRTMATQSASGNTRAGRNFLYAVDSVQRRRKTANDKIRQLATDYALDAYQEICRREAKGLPIDDVVPHPDNVRWDEETGMPYFSDDPVPTVDDYRRYLEMLDKGILAIEKQLEEEQPSKNAAMMREVLDKARLYKKIIEDMLRNKPKPV